MIIATTNAGSSIFQDDGKYSQELKYSQSGNEHARKIAMDAEIESLMKRLRTNLQTNGFKPELLARFNRIVPYRSLPEKTLLDISERELDILAKKSKIYVVLQSLTTNLVTGSNKIHVIHMFARMT